MEEENVILSGSAPEAKLGKFKSVDALMHAYEELEAEFTRRSQRLKALEEATSPAPDAVTGGKPAADPSLRQTDGEELYRAVMENDGVRARVLSDYLGSLRGVPLMTGSGSGVSAPADTPKSIAEAGALALGYLKSNS